MGLLQKLSSRTAESNKRVVRECLLAAWDGWHVACVLPGLARGAQSRPTVRNEIADRIRPLLQSPRRGLQKSAGRLLAQLTGERRAGWN